MAEHILYLFGDQTYDLNPQLKQLAHYKHNPLLKDFLTRAYDTLRVELFNLPSSIRDELPRYTCLDDVIFREQNAKRCIPLDMAVTCMYQLGIFIEYGCNPTLWTSTNNVQSQVDSQHYDNQRARALGLCTGALATAAIASSGNMIELIPLAVIAVSTAFRVGQRVMDVAERITPANGQDLKWSIIVPGVDNGPKAVRNFREQTVSSGMMSYCE